MSTQLEFPTADQVEKASREDLATPFTHCRKPVAIGSEKKNVVVAATPARLKEGPKIRS